MRFTSAIYGVHLHAAKSPGGDGGEGGKVQGSVIRRDRAKSDARDRMRVPLASATRVHSLRNALFRGVPRRSGGRRG